MAPDLGRGKVWSDETQKTKNVIISIVDTDIGGSHPGLSGRVSGSRNFSDSPDDEDRSGHGAHVAGIAGATTNNGLGVANLGHRAMLLKAKAISDSGSDRYSQVTQAIVWAADNGAKVINLSFVGFAPSQTLVEAIDCRAGRLRAGDPRLGNILFGKHHMETRKSSKRGEPKRIARGGGEVGQSYARVAIGVKATLEIQCGETITADSPFFYHLPRFSAPPANGSVRPKAFESSQRKGEREPLFVESTLLYTTWRTDKH